MIIITQHGKRIEAKDVQMKSTDIMATDIENNDKIHLIGSYSDIGRAVSIFSELTAINWSCSALEYVMPTE